MVHGLASKGISKSRLIFRSCIRYTLIGVNSDSSVPRNRPMTYQRPRISTALMVALPSAHVQALPNQPVSQLDLERYLGTWHEIAHLPMFFQRKCKDRITATYSRLPSGAIRVLNACRTHRGAMDSAEGVARPVGGARGGALKVRFAPAWLGWLPWVWADYWVIEVDAEYQWAAVGSPSRKYLWILSRSPSMPKAQFDALSERAAQRGYPVGNLVVAAPLD
jgi:apolipoprotein D and lipocalin family protein